MNKSARFWDKIAVRYSNQEIADEAAYQKKMQLTQKHFDENMKVLEIACGTGSTAIAHASYVKQIKAIDISPKMIEIAKEKANSSKVENVVFEVSSVDGLEVADHTLDVVLGHNILHLLENKEDAIAKIYTMLKPGGVFISSTACIGDSIGLKIVKFFVSIGAFFGLLPFLDSFTTKELKDSLTNAGFELDYQWKPKKNSALFIIAKKS